MVLPYLLALRDTFDPEAYGHTIYSVLQYPQIGDQLAKYGSQRARAGFTWMGIAQKILNILQGFRMHVAMDRHRVDRRVEKEWPQPTCS